MNETVIVVVFRLLFSCKGYLFNDENKAYYQVPLQQLDQQLPSLCDVSTQSFISCQLDGYLTASGRPKYNES